MLFSTSRCVAEDGQHLGRLAGSMFYAGAVGVSVRAFMGLFHIEMRT
ncbi:hypothetical protein [Bartonella doshiae]|nr:hypothetical protein [Bartonella doshiae]